MDAPRQSTYELQLRVEELKKRLKALDAASAPIDQNGDKRQSARDHKVNKDRVVAAIQSAVLGEKARLSDSKVRVNFPKNHSGNFSFELSGKSITWSDVRDRACIMFGHNPEETLVVELRHGQRVLVPGWKDIKPGREVDVEIVEKPPVNDKLKKLKSREKTSRPLSAPASSAYMLSGAHDSSSVQSSMRLEVQDGAAESKRRDTTIAMSREVIFDFFLHIALFLALAFSLVDPAKSSSSLRVFQETVTAVGKTPFTSMRSGSSTVLTFERNVTSIPEALDFVRGPLTSYLIPNGTVAIPPEVADIVAGNADISNVWWGLSPPDICPLRKPNIPPICNIFQVPSTQNRSRWVTQSLSTEVLGSVRLRQFRVRADSCELNRLNNVQRLLPNCYEDYSAASMSTETYGTGSCGFQWRSAKELAVDRPGAPTVFGAIAQYDPSGYVVDIPSALHWEAGLAYLVANNWIDDATKAVIIEYTVRAPNSEFFAGARAIIERDKTGAARTRFDTHAVVIPQTSCITCQPRFITDMVALVLILVILLRVLLGGFFYKPKQRLWRTYDFIFSCLFIGSFAVDMVVIANYPNWQTDIVSASTAYQSLDDLYYSVRTANRYRAVLILLITMRFLFQGSFSFSRVVRSVLLKLFSIYVLHLILLVPFICALTVLSMVLQQGSPVQLISFGNALRDIFLIVTGVTDSLTASTARVGRQTGWSIVFYLCLITFTWVLVVPTLIAWAVIVYEREDAAKAKYDEEQANLQRIAEPSGNSPLDTALASALPVPQHRHHKKKSGKGDDDDYWAWDHTEERTAAELTYDAAQALVRRFQRNIVRSKS